MPYYRICPKCGCHIDPGERCDCQEGKKETAPLPRETASGDRTPDTIISVRELEFKVVVE